MNKLLISAIFVITLFPIPTNAVTYTGNGWHIKDDATGGECSVIGNWDAGSKICTLSQDLSQGILIDSDNITLDGNNHTITGVGSGIGIYAQNKSRIIIKNFTVSKFYDGIVFCDVNNSKVSNNIVTNNLTHGIAFNPLRGENSCYVGSSNNNVIENNTLEGNITYADLFPSFTSPEYLFILQSYHISIGNGSYNVIQNNTIQGGRDQGIELFYTDGSKIVGNKLKNISSGIAITVASNNLIADNNIENDNLNPLPWFGGRGIAIYGNSFSQSNEVTGNRVVKYSIEILLSGNTNKIYNNTLEDGHLGLGLPYGNGNEIYNNNFINRISYYGNNYVYVDSAVVGNKFNLLMPTGGNYWSNYDEPTEGCNDINNDSFCDSPYIFTGGQDHLPWTKKDGWLTSTTTPPVISALSVSSITTSSAIITWITNEVSDTQVDYGLTSAYGLSTSLNTTLLTLHSVLLTNLSPSSIYHYSVMSRDIFGNLSVSQDFTFTTVVNSCCSNVLFLPGIEGSRLYVAGGVGGVRIWEPGLGSGSVSNLSLDENGFSERSDIITRDVIDYGIDSYLSLDIYASFVSSMDTLKSDNKINDWESIPYDWRLALSNILISGKKTGDDISYIQGTTTPYIIQELKRLASNSKTGKVTIIAHSNGGLVTKLLTKILGQEASILIDKIVFVAVPQVGTPEGVAGLLHGHGQAIPFLFSAEDARVLGNNMPVAYNLLPSEKYFSSVTTPVITFNTSLPDWIALYGSNINSFDGLQHFLTDTYKRVSPFDPSTTTPATINSALLSNANDIHENTLDNWQPPAGVKFITIAGWGNETLSQIAYKLVPTTVCAQTLRGSCIFRRDVDKFTFDPIHVVDGDGTVVEPSALWEGKASSTRYWVNLAKYNKDHPLVVTIGPLSYDLSYDHSKIFSTIPIKELLNHIILDSIIEKSTDLPGYVSTSSPTTFATSSIESLHFTLHSPLTLGFTDPDGEYSGSTIDSVILNVPGVKYERYGDVQWLSLPKGLAGQLVLHGTGSGSFTLDIDETSGNTETSSTSFQGIPSSTSTVATIDISPIFSPTASSTLIIDFDGDAVPDTILQAKENAVVPFDSIAPITTSMVFGTLWKNVFYVGTTTIIFTAEDNPGGAGIEKTEYSFDGGQLWHLYDVTTSPLLIDSEGTTTITYRSTDFFGNIETPKNLSVRIISVKWFLEDALSKLKSINNVGNNFDNEMANVIKKLEKGIADKLWLDRNHLSWPNGVSVLTNEVGIVKTLGQLIDQEVGQNENNAPTVTQTLYRDAQNEIVQSTALLSKLSFDKAKLVRAKTTAGQKALDRLIARIQKMQDRAIANELRNPIKAQQLYGAVWFSSEALLKAFGAVFIHASDLGGLYDPETMKDLVD